MGTHKCEPREVTRRAFVQQTAAIGALGVAVPHSVPASALGHDGRPGANDRLQIGLIGAGDMGCRNLDNCAQYPDVVVTGVCDVWKQRRDAVVSKFKDTARPYHDYREMLQQADIDAVIIATPPHWHAIQAIDACEAGKDFFLQKPMTLHLAESLAVKRAVEQHKPITQIGTQIHAGSNFRRIVEWIQSGRLGKINVVRTFNMRNQGPEGLGNPPNCDPPEGLDWELWVGPAPIRAFNPLIVANAYYHGSFMDFSGGWTPNTAPHIIDLPYWALKLGHPTAISCSGGRYTIHDAGDAYDTQEVLWQYPHMTMTWMLSLVCSYGFDSQAYHDSRGLHRGIYFHGVNGTLFANYHTCKVVPEGDRMENVPPPAETLPPSPGHEREWLDSLRTRREPSCNVAYHSKIDVAIVLANLSYKLGRSIRFDPVTEKIVDDEEATRLARPAYRASWKLPERYL